MERDASAAGASALSPTNTAVEAERQRLWRHNQQLGEQLDEVRQQRSLLLSQGQLLQYREQEELRCEDQQRTCVSADRDDHRQVSLPPLWLVMLECHTCDIMVRIDIA